MEKTLLVLLAVVVFAAAIAPTGALYQSNVEVGQGGLVSGLEPSPTPPAYDATVDFIITKVVNSWYYEFIIIIKNISDSPLSGWKLEFDYDGIINWIWTCTYIPEGVHNTCMPINEWQENYTIPAGEYTVLYGHGRSMGSEIFNVTVNGVEVPYSFYHDYTLDTDAPEFGPVPSPDAEPEPAPESAPEPTAEPKQEPAPETELPNEPVPEPASEPAAETEPEPGSEPGGEPAGEPAPEPAAEPQPEPSPGLVPEPAAEQASEEMPEPEHEQTELE